MASTDVNPPASSTATDSAAVAAPAPAAAAEPTPAPPVSLVRSVHSDTFPQMLRELGISVAVSTYAAGKLILLRAGPSGPLNANYRSFSKPMGMALSGERLAVGTFSEIWEFQNAPHVLAKADELTPAPLKHDACFMPRSITITGEIAIHEMAWVGDELWFVNTKYSCLCTRSERYSFEERWRPPFITALAPEDRCHLNGMCLRDGVPTYVTALGTGNTVGQWRENKKSGGVVMEIASNRIISTGRCMPHSPRWYGGRLWVLESGCGGLGYVDLQTGKYTNVATMPGFTRGLDFYGPFAFVGTSLVRGSSLFSGIPIASLPESERLCGVWVIDIQSGKLVGFVKFEGEAIQEIFAVQVLPGKRWPEVITDNFDLIIFPFMPPDQSPSVVI